MYFMKQPDKETIMAWKELCDNTDNTKKFPIKKSWGEILNYLKSHYSIVEVEKDELKDKIFNYMCKNSFYVSKIEDKGFEVRCYKIENIGKGKVLYKLQREIFGNTEIIIGIEVGTSVIDVEGSIELYDELTDYIGYDEVDVRNYILMLKLCSNHSYNYEKDMNYLYN